MLSSEGTNFISNALTEKTTAILNCDKFTLYWNTQREKMLLRLSAILLSGLLTCSVVSAAEPVSETAAKPAAKKAARKTAVKKPAAKKTTTRKTAAKATTKKAAEKAVEKPTEKAAEKPVEKPAEEPVKKTAAKTMAPADTVETTQPVQPKKKGAAKKAAK